MIKKFKELSKGKKIAVIGAVILTLGALGSPVEETDEVSNTVPEAVETVETAEKKENKEDKKEDATMTPEISEKYLKSVLGANFDSLTVTNEYGIIDIAMDVSDNITTDMMLGSNAQNIRDILKALKDTGLVNADDTVKIAFIGDTRDKLGNTSRGTWIFASYMGDTVNKANYDNLYTDDMYKIAENVGMLPNIRGDIKDSGKYAFLK